MADEGVKNTGIDALENFERALSHVRKSVQPLTLKSRDEVAACISPADRAKLDLQVAYGMTSLFYMFLRTQGVSPANHPVKTELDRIRDYFKRLKQVGKPPEQRTMKVDVAATRRFIDGALASDRVWQSAKSTDSKEANRRRAEAGIGRSLPAGQPENPPALPEGEGRDTPATPSSGSKRKHETPAVSSSKDATPREGGGSSARVEKGADVEQLEGAAAVAAAAAEESPRVVKKVKGSGKKWDKNEGKRHR